MSYSAGELRTFTMDDAGQLTEIDEVTAAEIAKRPDALRFQVVTHDERTATLRVMPDLTEAVVQFVDTVGTFALKSHSWQAFDAAWLTTVEAPKPAYGSARPYLKRKKGRS